MKFIEFCSRYKYIIALGIFAFCLLAGDNNIFQIYRLNSRISDLGAELREYKQTSANVKTQNSTLINSTSEEMEEYLRKHHNLKKDNEDVFRIVSSKSIEKTRKNNNRKQIPMNE